jgi:hypothetical protein
MKKIFLPLLFLSIASLFVSSCKKESTADNNGGGPDVLVRTEGFLCTMGIGRSGSTDTLTFYFTTGGQEIVGYLAGFTRPEDEINIINNGNNTVSIKKRIPYVSGGTSINYFAIKKNTSPIFSSFPDNEYLWYLYYQADSVETEFIVKRSAADNTKFTIESKSRPGYFLGTARQRNATYPTEARLVFGSKKQEFFFLVR